jgi:septum formation protein
MIPAEPSPRLILASKSPRRLQLLQMLGLEFEVWPAELDESYRRGEEPGAHAERLARAKALAIAADHADAVVIGSDTVVVVDGDVLGKPVDAEDAMSMLLRLAGREHVVATGIAIAEGSRCRSGVERVGVRFRTFDAVTARAYVETGEPMDKAGAYGIQGYGATLVSGITGDFFAVMGLPIARMVGLLAETGWRYDYRGLRREP